MKCNKNIGLSRSRGISRPQNQLVVQGNAIADKR